MGNDRTVFAPARFSLQSEPLLPRRVAGNCVRQNMYSLSQRSSTVDRTQPSANTPIILGSVIFSI